MGMKQVDIHFKARTITKITTIMVMKKTTKMMTITMKMMMLTMITTRMLTMIMTMITTMIMTMITSEQLKPEGERTHVDTPQQQRAAAVAAAVNIIDFQLCCPSTNFA